MATKVDKQASAGMMQMTSPVKIAIHQERLQALLDGKTVFPVTVEMDITTFCPQECTDCPSERSPGAQYFDLADIDRFFGRLDGQTRGLLLSGGEPTSSPDFPAFLKLARGRGFKEIAIVSNGANLDDKEIMVALLEDATVIRLSLYGWDVEVTRKDGTVLRKIEALRKQIDESGSGLHIGVSALTTHGRTPELGSLAKAAADAGAHWIYFHPMCTGWGNGHLRQADQGGVPEEITRLQKYMNNDFGVHYCPDRYQTGELIFNEYYSAHLLMVVGANGINYLGTETKYQEDYAIADIAVNLEEFPFQPDRLNRIKGINNRNYPPVGGRHRGLLYNHFFEQLKQGNGNLFEGPAGEPEAGFLYPYIL